MFIVELIQKFNLTISNQESLIQLIFMLILGMILLAATVSQLKKWGWLLASSLVIMIAWSFVAVDYLMSRKDLLSQTFSLNQQSYSIKLIKNDTIQEYSTFSVSKLNKTKKEIEDFKDIDNVLGVQKKVLTMVEESASEELFVVSCKSNVLSYKDCFKSIEKNFNQILITQNNSEADVIVLNQ